MYRGSAGDDRFAARRVETRTIGSQRAREELQHRKSAVALGLMRQIKTALDPLGLMNPGRVL